MLALRDSSSALRYGYLGSMHRATAPALESYEQCEVCRKMHTKVVRVTSALSDIPLTYHSCPVCLRNHAEPVAIVVQLASSLWSECFKPVDLDYFHTFFGGKYVSIRDYLANSFVKQDKSH